MNRLTDHLIVISLDCLSALDLSTLETLSHFQTILQTGAYVQKVASIYPSLPQFNTIFFRILAYSQDFISL